MSALFRTLVAAPLALAVALLTAAPAQASTIYTYTGNLFTDVSLSGPTAPADPYTTSDRVTGFIELAAPLAANLSPNTVIAPLSFSFSDGVSTITSATATSSDFSISTDNAGNIATWLMFVRIAPFRNGGGPNRKVIGTRNYVVPVVGSIVIDSGSDVLCGPGSTTDCEFSGDPFYSQDGTNSKAAGVWQRQTTPPPSVPEPTSLLLVGMALAGVAARRRIR